MYRNWPSRSDLVEAIYREDLAALLVRATRHRAEREPWDALVRWLRDYLGHVQDKRGMLAELGAAFDARPELLSESRRQVLEATAIVLDPARDAGWCAPILTAADLIQLVRGMVLPGVTPPSRYPFLLDIVLDGIRRV